MIYEGRLQSSDETKRHRLIRPTTETGTLPEAGLHFLPVTHEGNVQDSAEERQAIQATVATLLKRQVVTPDGTRPLKLEDIVIVAPYNLQVRRLQEMLPQAKIGSVDKFQGQQAEVVIVSLCSSPGCYGSRGLEFILDENRLNVAISRAKTLAIVVADPRIATETAATIPAMRRLSIFCRLSRCH